MPAFFSRGASRTYTHGGERQGQQGRAVNDTTAQKALSCTCSRHSVCDLMISLIAAAKTASYPCYAYLLEGGNVCEVVEADAEAHDVLRQRSQLALDQLCFADSSACSEHVQACF